MTFNDSVLIERLSARSDGSTRIRSFGDDVRVILGARSHGNGLIRQTLKHNYGALCSEEPERKIKPLLGEV